MRQLHLTHPFLQGADVRALQTALHTNPYGDFYQFAIDGVFGPLTAGRCGAAKWHLGYAPGTTEPIAGQELMDILTARKALPPAYAKLREARLHPQPPKPHPQNTMAQRALAWALTKVGQHEEPPGSNHCFATVEWGHGDMQWCDVFVSLAYIHAGSTAFSKSAQKWQYVPAMLSAAQDGNKGLHVVKFADLLPGDIIVHGPGAYHTTLNARLTSIPQRLDYDVGGNEGNLGYVYHDLHDASLADAFIRVER